MAKCKVGRLTATSLPLPPSTLLRQSNAISPLSLGLSDPRRDFHSDLELSESRLACRKAPSDSLAAPLHVGGRHVGARGVLPYAQLALRGKCWYTRLPRPQSLRRES